MLTNVSIIILAAGTSSRLGRPKQLLELDGKPLLRHTVRQALAAEAREVVLVLGNEAEAIGAAIGELGQRTVVNRRFAEGQSTSLVAGVAAVSSESDAAIVMLGDQPTVGTALVNQLIERFDGTVAAIVQPVYTGVPGNPVLFRRDLFPELLAITGDQGARQVIRQHRDAIERVEVTQSIPPDVDTEDDYARLRALWSTRDR